MIPIIALIGKPNVGKSTLFNYLTKSNDALVADFPGLTRDRKYGNASFEGKDFIVIDTGGIESGKNSIFQEMHKQTMLAIDEANLILFLVDAKFGPSAEDIDIASSLRKVGKPVIVVANKIDGLDIDKALSEFYILSLGEIYPVSAAYKIALTKLVREGILPKLNEFFTSFIEKDNQEDAEDSIKHSIKIALVGKPNVGKSTLTNRMLGESRVIVYDLPGTTRDSIYIPLLRDERHYTIIDTAGVRKKSKIHAQVEKFSISKTLRSIEDSNVALLLIDAREGIKTQDLALLRFILDAGKSLVIVVNKWDGLSSEIKATIKEELDNRLGFLDFARIHFISALHGSGVGNLFDSILEAYTSATKSYSTPRLTELLKKASFLHQPPMISGRRIKLKYAHLGGQNPPLIVIHGNQINKIPEDYIRYLANFFRKELGIIGTPLKLKFQTSDNPYKNKVNTLTPRQVYKRKRLLQHIKKHK